MKRVVIKIGTRVLSMNDETLDTAYLADVVAQIVALQKQGTQIILVTSGAVGAGKSLVELKDIQSEIVQKQVFAAIGQVKLMSIYSESFAKYAYHCAQVLVTKEDFRDDEHRINMQHCLEGLLQDGIISIVNENDVVATTELMFTDNDELAGLVAKLVGADSLVILTSTDGILDKEGNTIREVRADNVDEVSRCITPHTSRGGRGGMVSKFAVARELSMIGVTVHIVNGRQSGVLSDVAQGRKIGTRFSL